MFRKRSIFIALICSFCMSKNSFSQNTGKQTPEITFGEIDRGITTKEKILTSKLICHKPNCQITGYSVMILPKGRDLIGPYWVPGDQLTEKIKNTIKDLPDSKNKIFFDSIQVTNNDKKWQATAIYIQFGQ